MISNASLKAQEVFVTCGSPHPKHIPLEDLVVFYDGIVKEVPLNHCDGRTVMKHGRAIVSINSNIEYPQKKRFVVAHELGHLLLHKDKEAMFSDDYSTLEAYKHGPQEREANEFATELLMPGEFFKQACFKQKFGSDLIRNLSESFNTSLTSVVYRYIEKGPHPICVFYSKDGKIQYWKKSENFPYWPLDRSKLEVPGDSVAYEYYSKGKIYSKKDSDQQIFKTTWLELGKYGKDTPMFEFCIVTPRYNTVLSVIWEK